MLLDRRNTWGINADHSSVVDRIIDFFQQRGYRLITPVQQERTRSVVTFGRPHRGFWKELGNAPQRVHCVVSSQGASTELDCDPAIAPRQKWLVRSLLMFVTSLLVMPLFPPAIETFRWHLHVAQHFAGVILYVGGYCVVAVFSMKLVWRIIREGSRCVDLMNALQADLTDVFDARNVVRSQIRPWGVDSGFYAIWTAFLLLGTCALALGYSAFRARMSADHVILPMGLGIAALILLWSLGISFLRSTALRSWCFFAVFPSALVGGYAVFPLLLRLDNAAISNILEDAGLVRGPLYLGLFLILPVMLGLGVFGGFWVAVLDKHKAAELYGLFQLARKETPFARALERGGIGWMVFLGFLWIALSSASWFAVLVTAACLGDPFGLFHLPWFSTYIEDFERYCLGVSVVAARFWGLDLLEEDVVLVLVAGRVLMVAYCLPLLSLVAASLREGWTDKRRGRKRVRESIVNADLEAAASDYGTRLKCSTYFRVMVYDRPDEAPAFSLLWMKETQWPVMLLPKKALGGSWMSESEVRAILAHEVYHIAVHRPRLLLLRSLSRWSLAGSNLLTLAFDFWDMEFAADRFAAECVGAASIISALEKMTQVRKRSDEWNLKPSEAGAFSFSVFSGAAGNQQTAGGGTFSSRLRAKWESLARHFAGIGAPVMYKHPSYEDRIAALGGAVKD